MEDVRCSAAHLRPTQPSTVEWDGHLISFTSGWGGLVGVGTGRRSALYELCFLTRRSSDAPLALACRWWDGWIAVLIVYSVIFVPLRVGFAWRACVFQGDWWWDLFVDFCFAVDIAVVFRTAVVVDAAERNQQMIISDLRYIGITYLRTWFVPDFLSTIPINSIIDLSLLASAGSPEARELVLSCVENTTIASEPHRPPITRRMCTPAPAIINCSPLPLSLPFFPLIALSLSRSLALSLPAPCSLLPAPCYQRCSLFL